MTSSKTSKKTKPVIPAAPHIDRTVVKYDKEQKLSQASVQSLLEQHHNMREEIKAFDEAVKKPYEELMLLPGRLFYMRARAWPQLI